MTALATAESTSLYRVTTSAGTTRYVRLTHAHSQQLAKMGMEVVLIGL